MHEAEGATPLESEELAGLKFRHVTTRAELNQLEQNNIQQGLLWLQRQRKHKNYLTQSFVKQLHQKLFGQVWRWAGQFRKTEKNIGVDPLHISVELHKLLDDAQYWVDHHTYSREEFAARLHHRLVKIHPFANGNGRHARMMVDAVLVQQLHQPAINWQNNALVSEHDYRQEYISALRKADAGDYTRLIKFMSEKSEDLSLRSR